MLKIRDRSMIGVIPPFHEGFIFAKIRKILNFAKIKPSRYFLNLKYGSIFHFFLEFLLFYQFYLTYPYQLVEKITPPTPPLKKKKNKKKKKKKKRTAARRPPADRTSIRDGIMVKVMLKLRRHVASQPTQVFLEVFFYLFHI